MLYKFKVSILRNYVFTELYCLSMTLVMCLSIIFHRDLKRLFRSFSNGRLVLWLCLLWLYSISTNRLTSLLGRILFQTLPVFRLLLLASCQSHVMCWFLSGSETMTSGRYTHTHTDTHEHVCLYVRVSHTGPCTSHFNSHKWVRSGTLSHESRPSVVIRLGTTPRPTKAVRTEFC